MSTLGIVVGMKSEAAILTSLPHNPFPLIACAGANAYRAEQAARHLVKAGARSLVSFGVAGGLDPALKIGDLIVGTKVIAFDRPEALCTLDFNLPAAQKRPVAGSDTAVISAKEKTILFHKTRAAAVDMESHGVARAAIDLGLPFGVIRVISDTAKTTIPAFALLGIKPDGGLNPLPVALHLLRRLDQLPALLRLRRDTNQALDILTEAARSLALHA